MIPATLSALLLLAPPPGSPQARRLAEVLRQETAVWEALKAGDQARDAALLSEDFLGIYESGPGSRQDHVDQLSRGPSVLAYRIENPILKPLGNTTFLLTYKAWWVRPNAPEATQGEAVYITSIWQKRKGRWLNIFSQDTRARP